MGPYGEVFREAYAILHGGRPGDGEGTSERRAGEGVEEYLARTRSEALGVTRKSLLAAKAPQVMAEAHRLLLDLLSNAIAADEALAEQVRAYQCGQFHESVQRSDRLQRLVLESQRMDRDLINILRALPPETIAELGLDL